MFTVTYKIKKRKEYKGSIGYTWFELFVGNHVNSFMDFNIKHLAEVKRIIKEHENNIFTSRFEDIPHY